MELGQWMTGLRIFLLRISIQHVLHFFSTTPDDMRFLNVLGKPSLLAFIHQLQKLILIALSYILFEVICSSAQPLQSNEDNIKKNQLHQTSQPLHLFPHPKTCVPSVTVLALLQHELCVHTIPSSDELPLKF
jgi:hypothetical protein